MNKQDFINELSRMSIEDINRIISEKGKKAKLIIPARILNK